MSEIPKMDDYQLYITRLSAIGLDESKQKIVRNRIFFGTCIWLVVGKVINCGNFLSGC